jgi:hypothetical protein
MAVLLASTGWAGAQTPPQPQDKQQVGALPELWTWIEGKFDSSKLKEGGTVTVHTMQGWVYQSCGVVAETKLTGTVTSAKTWDDNARWTEVSLRFTADCADGTKVPLILTAAFYPLDPEKSQMDIYKAYPAGLGSGATGRQSTDLGRMPVSGWKPEAQMPLAKMGEVQRIPHLTLGVAKGPKESTVLRSTEKKLRLDAATRLVFVPVPGSR